MRRESLRLALDALEASKGFVISARRNMEFQDNASAMASLPQLADLEKKHLEAIDALQKALAQPKQKPIAVVLQQNIRVGSTKGFHMKRYIAPLNNGKLEMSPDLNVGDYLFKTAPKKIVSQFKRKQLMRFNPFPKHNCKYGALMGRSGNEISYLHNIKTLYAMHQGGSEGYDKGGAYWGYPCNVWAVWGRSGGEVFTTYVRATSKQEAINLVKTP